MGKIKDIAKVKLVIPIIYHPDSPMEEMVGLLVAQYGAIDFTSADIPFGFTNYYTEEMGSGLLKRFISFEQLIDRGELAAIKHFTNELEDRFASEGKRCINLDPGYMSLGKFVLATTKNQQHRLYIGQSMFAENALRFVEGSFCKWPWTYRDYKTKEYISIFNTIREIYYKQLLP